MTVFSQRIRATVNTQEQKRLLMDLDISMRTVDCFYTVTFYGALFREVTGLGIELVLCMAGDRSPLGLKLINFPEGTLGPLLTPL